MSNGLFAIGFSANTAGRACDSDGSECALNWQRELTYNATLVGLGHDHQWTFAVDLIRTIQALVDGDGIMGTAL